MDHPMLLPMISDVRYCTEPVRGDIHYHNEYELIYIVEGEIELTINSKVFRASKQNLILLSNLENHSIRQLSPNYHRYYITLNIIPTDSYIRNPDLLNILKNHFPGFVHCIDVSGIQDTVVAIFQKLLAGPRYITDLSLANELVGCYLSELLIHVAQLIPEDARLPVIHWRDRIMGVQNYLDIHFGEPIRIADVAKQFYISNCYLTHQFKELTGYSPKRYLILVRLKNAATMLLHSSASIAEISSSCGFTDFNNFSKQFRQVYGCSPSAFRAKLLG